MDFYFVQGIIINQSHYFDAQIILEWESIQAGTCVLFRLFKSSFRFTEKFHRKYREFPQTLLHTVSPLRSDN